MEESLSPSHPTYNTGTPHGQIRSSPPETAWSNSSGASAGRHRQDLFLRGDFNSVLALLAGQGPELGSSEPGSNSLHWWTRSQCIRTAGEMVLEVPLLEVKQVPLYQEIAPKAEHLKTLGLNLSCIARHLGVTDKTVNKAIRWHGRPSQGRP